MALAIPTSAYAENLSKKSQRDFFDRLKGPSLCRAFAFRYERVSEMTGRQGTGADIEQRFGYSQSGTFRCAYGNETPLLIILAAVTAVTAVAALVGISCLVNGIEAILFYAIVLVISETVVVFTAMCLAKLILYGKECFYHADEQKLSVERAGKFDDIFYSNVVDIRYDPLVTLGKQRGFVVSVTTVKSTVVYKYIFARRDVVMSPEKTPFAIIEERSGLKARQPQPAVKKPETAVREEPAPSFTRRADENAVISRSHSEEEEIITKGSFYTPHKYELLMFVVCTVLGIAAAVDSIYDFIVEKGDGLSGFSLIAGFIFVVLDIAVFRMIRCKEYKYISDSKEFRISDKSGVVCVIYYCDAERVEYKPYKLLWKQRGYTVSIVMKYTTVKFNYLFLRNKKYQRPQDTPFNYIERMISGEYQNSAKLGRN
ncbi:MAG: hypothetical protein ACI4KA_09225 [Oscillospiraceae bacterium]